MYSWLMNEAFNVYISITYTAHNQNTQENSGLWRYYIIGWGESRLRLLQNSSYGQYCGISNQLRVLESYMLVIYYNYCLSSCKRTCTWLHAFISGVVTLVTPPVLLVQLTTFVNHKRQQNKWHNKNILGFFCLNRHHSCIFAARLF